jgi:PAS domain S-box-containing protein
MDEKSRIEFDKEFRDYHLPASIPIMRVGLTFTAVLFIVFAILNVAIFPGSNQEKFMLRFGIILPFILASIIVISIKSLRKNLNTILTVINIMVGFGIFAVGAFADITSPVYNFYYTWVGLVIIGIFTFYRLRFRNMTIVGLSLLLSYAAAIIVNESYIRDPEFFLNQLLLVIALTSVGFFIAYIIEMKNRKDFIQHKALSDNYSKLINEMNDKKSAEEALVTSRKQYLDTLNAIPDWIHVVDREMKVVLMNNALKEVNRKLGFDDSVAGKYLYELYPFLKENVIEETQSVFMDGSGMITQEKNEFEGRVMFTETRKIPIIIDGKVIQVMTIMRDISKEKEVEELKLKSAEQKEVMLREIHHRVKNNLAIVISLLSLQIRHNPNPELKKSLKDIELRIRSMALIHEHLYRADNYDRIPLANYLHSLASIILGTLGGGNIRLVTDLEPTDISIETALPLGLITNELLTNAVKYAFPNQEDGELRVTLKSELSNGGNFKLTIKDNGIGLPDSFSIDNQTSMGMFIIKLLIQQLGAKLEFCKTPGACFTISFRNLVV